MSAPHVTTVKVRGYHCDFYGHVNNARYLELLEEARWSFLEGRVDLSQWQARDIGIVVARVDIRFRRPAPEGTVLRIETAMHDMGPKIGVVSQTVRNADSGKTVAEALVSFAVVDTRTGRARLLEGELAAPFLADGDD